MPKKQKTGIAFGDFVTDAGSVFGSGRNRHTTSPFKGSGAGILLPLFFLFVVLCLLGLRLFYLQIIRGSYFSGLALANKTRVEIIPAPRGIIFDRNGKPIVRNVPVFEILENGKVKILDKDSALTLISQGKPVISTTLREYLYKSAFGHVVGYTGQISQDELSNQEFSDYALSDFVGKMGLESQYESMLHGQNGKQIFEVDATGKKTNELGKQDEIPGENLHTTLDVNIQLAVADAMKDVKKGAVVVSDPRDGGILAIYSKPAIDPNLFTHSKSYVSEGDYSHVEQILEDSTSQPLLDRAIGGAYPPGSTFKLVTAAAALMSGAIKPDTEVVDTGVLKVGAFSFGNWYFLQYGRTEGALNVVGALKRSNDIFFYKAAEETGITTVSNWARQMGLGEKLGIDLPGEVSGTVPTESWKKRVIGEQWYLGDTYNYGIGQGYLLTTPLQVNFWTSIFANEGTLYKPHLIKGVGKTVRKNIVKQEYADLIRKGMEESCQPGGVAWPLFDFKVPAKGWSASGGKNRDRIIDEKDFTLDSSGSAEMVRVAIGCKTGTAEVGDEDTKSHAWITVFAPFYNPEIVVTVLVENGGEGSSDAGPIAKNILTAYFEKKQ